MAFLMKECDRCGDSKAAAGFYESESEFFPHKRLNICKDCVEKMLREHPQNLEFANKLCQWADLPFDPNEWIRLEKANGARTFEVYYDIHSFENRDDISWSTVNEKWRQARLANTLEDKIEVLNENKLNQLRKKWGMQYDEEELNYLEQLFNGILQTQNVSGKLQLDQAIKLCQISLIIDQKIRAGEDFKDLLTNYDKLVKVADFTPKNTKNAGDFDSAGEICAYLEKTGWINKYYDGVSRDIVDQTMKNFQSWVRYLYINETNIPEDIQKKIEGLKIAQQLENSEDIVDETELDKYEQDAFKFDEEFDPELT